MPSVSDTNSPSQRERRERLNTLLWQAAFVGMLKGLLVGLVLGFYLSYRKNHGPNTGFFKTPYKVWWMLIWNVAGIMYSTDLAKIKMSREFAVEDEMRRTVEYQEEMYGRR